MFELTRDEKRVLLGQARQSIQARLDHNPLVAVGSSNPKLMEDNGVFITLRNSGKVRGCVGVTFTDRPLIENLHKIAEQAAFNDPRYVPVTKDEMKHIDIELTVLSPYFPITPDEIEIGVHGLIIDFEGQAALLLPQVAVEEKLDQTAFLEAVCAKAGLPKDAYKKDDVKLAAFTAVTFSENELNG